MNYDICIDHELVGSGLSHGEACQWLLDLDGELSPEDSVIFRSGLGFTSGDFENFLYSRNYIDTPKEVLFGLERLVITETD